MNQCHPLRFEYCTILLMLIGLWLLPLASIAAVDGLNGTWQLDEDASDSLEKASRKLSIKLNAEWRERRENKFTRDQNKPQSKNRFQNQLDATESMINEDSRSIDWGGSDGSRLILESQTIKLYQGRKVVVLYDGKWKRVLTINPAGRAYSVSGTEITTDDLGRVLTFFDKNDSLVIETDAYAAGKLIEIYRLDGSSDRIIQELSVQERKAGPELTMKRYFNRVR